MKIDKMSNMKGGWFIGDFQPSLLQTKDFGDALLFTGGKSNEI